MGETSPNTQTIRTQNQFNFPQHNAWPFHSMFPKEVDDRQILVCQVKAKPHEERRERPNRPTFVNELSDADMDRRYDSCHALLDT
jgi:hypothetical protein